MQVCSRFRVAEHKPTARPRSRTVGLDCSTASPRISGIHRLWWISKKVFQLSCLILHLKEILFQFYSFRFYSLILTHVFTIALWFVFSFALLAVFLAWNSLKALVFLCFSNVFSNVFYFKLYPSKQPNWSMGRIYLLCCAFKFCSVYPSKTKLIVVSEQCEEH